MTRRLHTTRLLRAEETFSRTAAELISADAGTHGPASAARRAAAAAADAARRAAQASDPRSRVAYAAGAAQEAAAVARETKILAMRALPASEASRKRLVAIAGKAARAESRAAAAANRALSVSGWVGPLRAGKVARQAGAAAAGALEEAQRTLSALTETLAQNPEQAKAARKPWLRRAAASRHVLGMAASLLPAAQRDRWREEWISQLTEKATRWERANWSLSLLLNGAPRMAVTLRRKVSRTIR
ncbi:hypothetical protein Aph01nite_27180 [Acrocarpospora phusangensis]|uniref:Uncharacterized protein n=1 Tax=Acrocarpospora phusangensis TaxID=1070424 RepID=A0A919UNJ8_9ACTN|nr:hypothetical protein [Acrocarpospora phusangensis]GIH24408.1 hypothetical protein Aph01nite_27180 [Acrocarpospora phusangensis]